MNATRFESTRQLPERVTLEDKYSLDHGRAFMSGVQALVKLPMLQRLRDQRQGKNTAGFISGYRGSPLGGYDLALAQAEKYLKAQNIVFQPGVNEELAATALWGTQQLGFAAPGSNKFDGVFGIWYGKGPGVDRCGDVFKHANMAGTTPWGGVIAVAGDDHMARSSTATHQSDFIFKACGTPVFFPASVQEILDLGLHAFALSRFSGVWAGLKTIQEIVESSASVMIDPQRVQIKIPSDFQMPSGGVHIRWPDQPLEQEARLFHYKWYAALAYIRANRLNYNVIEGQSDRLGLIASGKAFNDTRQALLDLGLDVATCQQLGIRLHKVGVVWPLEGQLTREFATGLQEILVVEEKLQMIEGQLKEELFGWPAAVRPRVFGKFSDMDGDHCGGEWSVSNPLANTLLRANADLSPAIIARAIVQRLQKIGVDVEMSARLDARMALLQAKENVMQALEVKAERQPWFCSGCPHNTSTKLPEGSRAMAGIGCHFMSVWMNRATVGFTQMGGEGVPWVGQQPFSHGHHMFANLGDGTYFHSGLLAIRQAIAAGVNITYKILYNDAVAMTGGQQVGERPEGHSVAQIAQSMRAEGANKIVVVTDEPQKYQGIKLVAGVAVQHRDELDRIQREFREILGTTIIIYDQTCATEKRRRRKRGTLVDPAKRVLINELVCEGCGDCGVQSNCLSVEPLETEFGRKRKINQSTCNKDYSCVKGFCPSFVTVEGGQLRKKTKDRSVSPFELGALPQPALPLINGVDGKVWGIVVAGVGGTGVITIGQLLGMAAHLDGKSVVTQDAGGLAQKGGATWSHVLIGSSPEAICTTRVSMATADLIIGCDPIVAAAKETVLRMCAGRTHVALNSHATPTAAFVSNANWANPAELCVSEVVKAVGLSAVGAFNADAAATQLMGDSIYTNPMLLGYAWQKGWIPLDKVSLLRSIELNAVAVEQNKTAFEWGRRAAHDSAAFEKLLNPPLVTLTKRRWLDELIDKRVEFLTAYQDATYAESYQTFVQKVRRVEEEMGVASDIGSTHSQDQHPSESHAASTSDEPRLLLTEAVARYLFKLMAYKDEYEVARLHTHSDFHAKISALFEGDFKLYYHLAPPLLARRNEKGELQKQKFGPATGMVFKALARFKFLRGTVLDIFGRTEERRQERALITQYRSDVEEILDVFGRECMAGINQERYQLALSIARSPEQIKGFGHVKMRSLKAARQVWQDQLTQFRNPRAQKSLAASTI